MYPNNVNVMNVPMLGIYCISLLALYVLNPSTEWLIGVIVFFLIGIGLMFWGGPIGRMAGALLTGAVVVVAVLLWGSYANVNILGILVGIGGVVLMIWWLYHTRERSTIYIPPNTAIIVKRGEGLIKHEGPRTSMLGLNPYKMAVQADTLVSITLVDRIVARIPLYPKRVGIEVEDVWTKDLDTVKTIKMGVQYAVVDPLGVYVTFSLDKKSESVFDGPSNNLMTLAFWEEAIDGFVKGAAMGQVRRVIHETIEKGMDVYGQAQRDAIIEEVKARLNRAANPIGLEIRMVTIDDVLIDPEKIKRSKRNKERELEEAKHKALCEAQAIEQKGLARAKVIGAWISEIVTSLTEQNIPVTREVIAEIVHSSLGKVTTFGHIEHDCADEQKKKGDEKKDQKDQKNK